MQTFWQDLRYGTRMLLKKPGFTLIAIFTLALGIGANTAIFSVVYTVLLRALPYQQADRLMLIGRMHLDAPSTHPSPAAPAIFLDWRERQHVFDDIAAYEDASISKRALFYLSGGDVPERIRGARVSVNLCALLGVKAVLGRTFLPEEQEPGRERVMLISAGLWRRRFGADPKVVGQTIKLNDQPHVIVGVMPSEFKLSYPQSSELWTPISFGPNERNNRGEVAYRVIGRLRSGVTLEQARGAMNNLALALAQAHPKTDQGRGVMIVPWHEELFGATRTPLLMLLIAVGLVLLIACVNVVNLLLARAMERTKELAVRAALGASRWRLMRQMLTESVLLALLGGTLGVLLALWGRDLLVELLPASVPRGKEVAIDLWVLGFTSLLSLAAGMSLGLLPGLRASKPDLSEALKAGTKNTTASLRARHLRGVLVVAEVALALVLLSGAGLMIRSLWQLQQVKLGFEPEKILTMQFTIPRYRRLSEAQQADFIERVLARVKSLPGVVAAASTTSVPLAGVDYIHSYDMVDATGHTAESKSARWRVISTDYFRVLKIPVLKGRAFTEQDFRSSPAVAILSETAAHHFFPGAEPLGQRLRVNDDREAEIIGVVGDVHHNGIRAEMEPAVYEPLDQTPVDPVCLVVRVAGAPLSLSVAVQQAVWAEDKDQPVENISTMEHLVSVALSETRFYSLVLGAFALVALLLGMMGIYGVMSYTVAQRTHEIGIRLALGAQVSDVRTLIVGQGLRLAVSGIGIGLAVALGLTRLMSSLLFGVSSADPLTFAAIALLLLSVALLACYIPARRAMKVDPMVALRYE